MNNTPQQLSAQQVRDQYRARRQKHLAQRHAELPSPVFPDGAVIDPDDGTLNKDVLKTGLVLNMPAWPILPPPGLTSHCYLMWARDEGSGPPPDGDYKTVYHKLVESTTAFPLQLTLAKEELGLDGKYYLRVRVEHFNLESEWSPPQPVICDHEPPYEHLTPARLEAPSEPVTDQYLANNGGKVILHLPEYDDYQDKDKVRYYWGTLPVPEDPVTIIPVGTVEVDSATWPMPLEVPASHIIAQGDGGCYALYVLIDKATNVSRVSFYTELVVALGTLPDGMQAPEVPLADDNGLLDGKDAAMGVMVEIPAFQNYKPNDKIVVTWGTIALEPDPIGSVPHFPLEIAVPPAVLKTAYGSATGDLDTKVSYVVRRGGLDSQAKETTITVNFWTPGPTYPEWPDPVNPALELAFVMGEVSQTKNQLTRADNGKDATLTFKIYADRVSGDVVKFYWADTHVVEADYTVTASDAIGAEIERTLPWKYIEGAYNDKALRMYFEITNPGSSNSQRSGPTLVDADAVIISPPAPKFQGLVGAAEMLTCQSIYKDDVGVGPNEPSIRVEVGDLSQPPYNLKDGDKVTMKWHATDPSDVIISGTELIEDITLGVEFPKTGFVWEVHPYATKILPTYNPGSHTFGFGIVSYSWLLGSETINSGTERKMVAMTTPTSSCQLRPDP